MGRRRGHGGRLFNIREAFPASKIGTYSHWIHLTLMQRHCCFHLAGDLHTATTCSEATLTTLAVSKLDNVGTLTVFV